jgi:hypothetical protein
MADQRKRSWTDRLREWRRERRIRSIERRRRRSEHLRTLDRSGRSRGGTEYDMNARNVRADWPVDRGR